MRRARARSSSPGPLAADATLCFIGRIETPWRDRGDCPRRGDAEAGPLCRLVLDPRWIPACDGLEPGAELQLLYWMHEARRDLVRLSPGPRSPARPVRAARPDAAQPDRVLARRAGVARGGSARRTWARLRERHAASRHQAVAGKVKRRGSFLLPPAGEGGPAKRGRMRALGVARRVGCSLFRDLPHPTRLCRATFSRRREKDWLRRCG